MDVLRKILKHFSDILIAAVRRFLQADEIGGVVFTTTRKLRHFSLEVCTNRCDVKNLCSDVVICSRRTYQSTRVDLVFGDRSFVKVFLDRHILKSQHCGRGWCILSQNTSLCQVPGWRETRPVHCKVSGCWSRCIRPRNIFRRRTKTDVLLILSSIWSDRSTRALGRPLGRPFWRTVGCPYIVKVSPEITRAGSVC